MDIESEDWKRDEPETDTHTRTTVEKSLTAGPASSSVTVSRPDGEGRTRCGSHGRGRFREPAREVADRMKISHDAYDSKMAYGKNNT